MKTIEEAAREYAKKTDKANAEWVAEDFTEGVKYAQRWIRVEDELPELGETVLVKEGDKVAIAEFTLTKHREPHQYFLVKSTVTMGISHWRPIELK